MQASFLRIKLPYLDEINTHKRKLAQLYTENLNDSFIKPKSDPDFYNVFHIYNILHPERDRLKQYLLENNIGTEVHYPVAPQDQPALKDYLRSFDYPVSAKIHQQTLSLPCSFAHTEADVLGVIRILNKFHS